ncbi:hypothetical protein L7F22_024838 [Adiantum nelumboides]|nr:hypothetical protein [Adiantum nelumboides]
MQALHIPNGVERVLFRTLNTDRRLMWKRQFDSSYVGFTSEGAEWLRDNTKIKLVGVIEDDYNVFKRGVCHKMVIWHGDLTGHKCGDVQPMVHTHIPCGCVLMWRARDSRRKIRGCTDSHVASGYARFKQRLYPINCGLVATLCRASRRRA